RATWTGSDSLDLSIGAAIQPCVSAAPPLAGWIQTTETDDEASWKLEPKAVACRTSVPVFDPTYGNTTTPLVSVIDVVSNGLAPATVTWTAKLRIGVPRLSVSVAVSVSVWPVSSGPGADSATPICAPTSDGSGSTVTVARSATVRKPSDASSC